MDFRSKCLHNNQQNALANAIMSIKKNIDIIDTTVLGMGRGAGNLSTEQMIKSFFIAHCKGWSFFICKW